MPLIRSVLERPGVSFAVFGCCVAFLASPVVAGPATPILSPDDYAARVFPAVDPELWKLARDPANKLAPVEADGLIRSVRVRRDAHDVPHIFALNEHDALFLLGWVHSQDRFFQMDVLRRQFSGTLAELVGEAALEQDINLRTLGLRRAAEATAAALPAASREWMEAYAEGVNAWLAANPLPIEYGALELTAAEAWTLEDTLVIGKGLGFGLSFDLDDLDRTLALLSYDLTGQFLGFDGVALFTEDLFRSAPFDPSVSIPPAAGLSAASGGPDDLPTHLRRPGVANLLAEVSGRLRATPALRSAFGRRDAEVGSNFWVASGDRTDSGYPILANDPHLGLDAPAIFYEVQIRVARGADEPMNVFGVSFPGTAGVIQGCNPWICWGSTTNPMDVTDIYLEQLVVDPGLGLPTHTVFRGELEPIAFIPQTFLVNVVGDSIADNLVDAGIGPLDGGLTLIVPRRNNGPIIGVDLSDPLAPLALSVQYTGWGPTFELDAIRQWARARTVDAFVQGLQSFDVGSQNWAYADRDGNIAYFTSAEMPLREDLQAGAPAGGTPPWFLRDGTGTLAHEWLPVQNPEPDQAVPYAVLPFAEMPQVVNPVSGFTLNCNNDPVGTSLDNNPLNQLREQGGLYYLSPGYASGFRMGRIQRLVDAELAADGSFSMADFAAFQANNQLLDAEVLVPFVLDAWAAASVSADPVFEDLIDDPRVDEAIGRLAFWDFSTPTGIPEGFDPGDDPSSLPTPSAAEAEASVAATIYSAWRGQIVRRVIDATLAPFGLEGPGSSASMVALRHLLDTFGEAEGFGASGLDFFAGTGAGSREAARDAILLECLRDALDLLAGEDFAPAFGMSTDQADYRWGLLHRIVLEHPLGGPFSTPPVGLPNLGEELPGIARSGGFGALDASSHSSRADGVDDFMFGSGPARRFLGEMTPDGPNAVEVIPGGTSGVLGSPFQADQLLLWLTNDYHPWVWRPLEVIGASRTFQQFFPLGEVPAGD